MGMLIVIKLHTRTEEEGLLQNNVCKQNKRCHWRRGQKHTGQFKWQSLIYLHVSRALFCPPLPSMGLYRVSHYYHFLSISLWMLAVWLDFFFYFPSSFERFCCTIFFLVQLLSFLSLSRLAPDAAADKYTAAKRELSGAESITCPKLYTTLHCQHQSLSQWVSESTWLHYSY